MSPNFLSVIKSGLAKSPLFSIFPGSILMIPLEMLADFNFSCPCHSEWNTRLIGLIFSGPVFFILALMLIYFLNVKSEEKREKRNKGKAQIILECCRNIFMYLFPPVLWITLLLIDGDYMACSATDWEGEYVLDDKLKMKWCKPFPGRNETELQTRTLKSIHKSQHDGYTVLLSYSISTVVLLFCCICCYYHEELKTPSEQEENLKTQSTQTS